MSEPIYRRMRADDLYRLLQLVSPMAQAPFSTGLLFSHHKRYWLRQAGFTVPERSER